MPIINIVRANKKFYPQTLLEECKYEIKKKLLMNLAMDLIMKNLIINLFMINLIINLKIKLRLCFNNNNKSLIVCINYALLGVYLY